MSPLASESPRASRVQGLARMVARVRKHPAASSILRSVKTIAPKIRKNGCADYDEKENRFSHPLRCAAHLTAWRRALRTGQFEEQYVSIPEHLHRGVRSGAEQLRGAGLVRSVARRRLLGRDRRHRRVQLLRPARADGGVQ